MTAFVEASVSHNHGLIDEEAVELDRHGEGEAKRVIIP